MNRCSYTTCVASSELLCTHIIKIIDMLDTERGMHVESVTDPTYLRLSLIRVLLVILHKMACDVAADVRRTRMRIVELSGDEDAGDSSHELRMHAAFMFSIVYMYFANFSLILILFALQTLIQISNVITSDREFAEIPV